MRRIRPIGRASHERRAALHRRRRAAGARPRLSRPSRQGYEPRAVDGGRTRFRRDLRVPAARRRDLHHLHLLGGSGFAYGKGAPAYYILCYGTLAYVLSYFMLPPIWRYAKQNRLYSQSDFFVRKYDSPALGVLVSIVGIVALIPYLVLQFKGLGSI